MKERLYLIMYVDHTQSVDDFKSKTWHFPEKTVCFKTAASMPIVHVFGKYFGNIFSLSFPWAIQSTLLLKYFWNECKRENRKTWKSLSQQGLLTSEMYRMRNKKHRTASRCLCWMLSFQRCLWLRDRTQRRMFFREDGFNFGILRYLILILRYLWDSQEKINSKCWS